MSQNTKKYYDKKIKCSNCGKETIANISGVCGECYNNGKSLRDKYIER